MVFCLRPHKEIVEILLQYGADPSILNDNNNNALDIAKSIAKDKCGCEEIIKLLENSLNLGSGIKKFVELLPDKPNIVSEEELSKELVGEEYANYDYLLCCIIS